MTESSPTPSTSPGAWRTAWSRYRRHKLGVFGLTMVLGLFFVGFFAPLIANDDPIVCRYEGTIHFPAVVETLQNVPFVSHWLRKSKPFRFASFDFKSSFDPQRGDWAIWPIVPFGPVELVTSPLQRPSRTHWLGTDESGRDVLSRIIHGTGISMKVGFISMGLATIIGLLAGAAAGYHGGWFDIFISRVIEIVMCFPSFFLVLAILAWLPPKIEYVMIVIGLTRWVGIARYARGEILRLRESDFAMAARALGASSVRVVLRHLVPNSLAPVLVSVTFGIASAVLIEAGLSWLGFGVQPPQPSWGTILRAGYENLLTSPHMIPPACAAIFLAVLSLNLVGDTLRDVTDPRLHAGETA